MYSGQNHHVRATMADEMSRLNIVAQAQSQLEAVSIRTAISEDVKGARAPTELGLMC